MGILTAPYNSAMRLGCGFNSFTQTICVNDAVVKDNRQSATEADLRQTSQDDTNPDDMSQIVTYSSSFVEHVSEVMDAMDISGSVKIKLEGLGGGGGSASYLNTNSMKSSDINFLVQVKVINQKLVANDVTRFNVIPNLPANAFTETYGDSFVSGFLEGGEFYALLSIKIKDSEDRMSVKAQIEASITKPGLEVDGEVKAAVDKANCWKDTQISISVAWSGGGEIRPEKDRGQDWTIDSMKNAANGFAERVARCPQRTSAILTKYSALRSFQELTNKGSPLDYENAGVYTNALLDAYMDYKDIWKTLSTMTIDVQNAYAVIARENDQEIQDYAKEAQLDYEHRAQAYFFPETKFDDLAMTPVFGHFQSETAKVEDRKIVPVTSDAKEIDGSDANKAPVYDMNLELARVSNKIIEAKKKLQVLRAGELYEPPLRFNDLKPYAGSLLGLDRARRDCRWEMIKIVREVDAVTLDPKVAIDTQRNYQYLNPAVFRQLIPTYHPKPPPYTLQDMQKKNDEIAAVNDLLKKEQAARQAAIDAAVIDAVKPKDVQIAQLQTDIQTKQAEIDRLNAETLQQVKETIDRIDQNTRNHGSADPVPNAASRAFSDEITGPASQTETTRTNVNLPPPGASTSILQVICGLTSVNYGPGGCIPNTGCQVVDITRKGFTILRSGIIDVGARWMTLPDSGPRIETGLWDIITVEPHTDAGWSHWDLRCWFRYPFKGNPAVVAWLQAVDIGYSDSGRSVNVSCLSSSPDSCVIRVRARGDANPASCRVAWLAYEADERRIRSGVCNAGDPTSPISLNFGDNEVGEVPAVFMALSSIDCYWQDRDPSHRVAASFSSVSGSSLTPVVGGTGNASGQSSWIAIAAK